MAVTDVCCVGEEEGERDPFSICLIFLSMGGVWLPLSCVPVGVSLCADSLLFLRKVGVKEGDSDGVCHLEVSTLPILPLVATCSLCSEDSGGT